MEKQKNKIITKIKGGKKNNNKQWTLKKKKKKISCNTARHHTYTEGGKTNIHSNYLTASYSLQTLCLYFGTKNAGIEANPSSSTSKRPWF